MFQSVLNLCKSTRKISAMELLPITSHIIITSMALAGSCFIMIQLYLINIQVTLETLCLFKIEFRK